MEALKAEVVAQEAAATVEVAPVVLEAVEAEAVEVEAVEAEAMADSALEVVEALVAVAQDINLLGRAVAAEIVSQVVVPMDL